MIHPNTEIKFISHEVGYGVVTTQFIPRGTITWALDKLDREFTPFEVHQMDDFHKDIVTTYTFRNSKGNFVLCWDNGRFVNHSFNSNCISTAYDFEIAVRDIEAGEQLTDDYGYLNITEPFEALPEGGIRQVVYPDDLKRYHRMWDEKLTDAFGLIVNVDQPLRHLISDELWQKVADIIDGKQEMDSILTLYYDEEQGNQTP